MNRKRILVADDEPHMSRVIELFLRREGYDVDMVRDGQEALDSILRSPPDVLVTDINMPRMTGQALCMELEKQLPQREFKIIIMTSMTDSEHRDWSRKMRDTLFMEKPVSMRLMVSTLAKYFGNGHPAGRSSDA